MTLPANKTAPDIPRHRFEAGQVLMTRGEPGDCAWLIVSGTLTITILDKDGHVVTRPASTYEVVGEMALIDDGVRTATVTAASPVSAIRLTRQLFARMLAESPPLGRYLITSLVQAIRHAQGLPVQAQAAAGPDIRSVEHTNRILERRVLRPDQVVFHEGDQGESAYLIQSGRVRISRDGAEIDVIGPGRIFGEMALIRHAPRSATATAVGGATVEIINRHDFERAVEAMPPTLRGLVKAYVEQLSRRPKPKA